MAVTAPLISNPAENRGPVLIIWFVAFVCAALAFIGLRLAIRIHRQLLGWDDLTIVLASIASIAQTIFVGVAVHHGYGRHIGDISKPELKKAQFWFYICQICYKCAIWPTKVSILLMYLRIFGDTPSIRAYGMKFRHLALGLMAFVVMIFIATSIVGVFACTPVRFSWDKSIAGGHCVQQIPWWYSYAALNISTDIAILALPMPLIQGLMQIKKRQKLILTGIFLLGGFVCVVTIVRMTTLKTGSGAADPTYNGVDTLQWTGVETNVGLICACLPLLRPVLNRVIPWFGQRTVAGTYNRPTAQAAVPYHSNSAERKQRATTNDRSSWQKWTTQGDTVILNDISTHGPESRSSSQVGITDGICKKVDVETKVENLYDQENERDREHDRREVQMPRATEMRNVV
ncbi:hypothetical protein LTR95_008530 [Oleoguttula sp. CCFEE 5521]